MPTISMFYGIFILMYSEKKFTASFATFSRKISKLQSHDCDRRRRNFGRLEFSNTRQRII